MPALTPRFMLDFESRMRLVAEEEYSDVLSSLWAPSLVKRATTGTLRELVTWFLDTATIEYQGESQQRFEDLVTQQNEFEVKPAGAGFRIHRDKLEDLDGNGIQAAAEWSRQVGNYAAYWIQKVIADAIKDEELQAYDGKAYFSDNTDRHPVNPFNLSAGSYANHFTGAAVTTPGAHQYPGALPIAGVSVETGLDNLARARSYIANIKMPNGLVPRGLRVVGILCPPALTTQFDKITEAKFMAQATTGGAGSGDMTGVQARMGLGPAIEAPELGAEFGGSDTDYYLITSRASKSQLGAFTYVERSPFAIQFHGPMTTAELSRKQEFEWHMRGRNIVAPGHPYGLFKCSAT